MKTQQSSLYGVNFGAVFKHISFGMAGLFALSLSAQASSDYGPAIWRPACSGHWNTSGNGKKFHVVHDMEGYYASTISMLQGCSGTVSIHYCANGKQDTSSDYASGEITQMVLEQYYAWHARCWNGYSTGTEHEGFVSNPAWFTEAMYQSSAGITRHEAEKYGYAKDRNHVIGHDEHMNAAWRSYASANFGIDPTCNSHDDPGPYWDWTHYMSLVNGTTLPTHINVYYRGSDAALKYVYYSSGWGAIQDRTGSLATGSTPSAIYYPSTGVHNVFVRGSDGVMYYQYYSGGWSPWQYIGPINMAAGSSPNAIITTDGIPNIYYRGTDGGLKYIYYAGGWSGEQSIAGTAMAAGSSPAAVITTGGILNVYYRGTDGGLKYAYYAGGWGAPQSIAGTAVATNVTPAPIMTSSGVLNVYYRGTDGALKYVYYSSGWGAQQSIAGTAVATDCSASPIVATGGILNVYYRGTDGLLKYVYYSSGWGAQQSIAGTTVAAGSTPSALVNSSGIANIFYRDANNALQYVFYASGSWSAQQRLTADGLVSESPVTIQY